MTALTRAPRAAIGGALLASSLLAGCATRTPAPLTASPVVDAHDRRVRALQRDIAALLDVPALRLGVAAVVVRSADRGDTLFSDRAETLVMPASNMKLVTLAAAAERLGWDYRFTTTIVSAAPVVDGLLAGDLIVVGTGDPSIGSHEEPASAVMDRWAEALWQMGLRHVDGRLLGDDRAFGGEALGAGWAWDDLGWGYSAPTSALQANVDAAEVTVTPASVEGAPAQVTLAPPESALTLDALVTTGPAGTAADLDLFRRPGTLTVRVRGVVPADGTPLVRTAAVDRPTDYFLKLLLSALTRRGIVVRDGASSIGAVFPAEWPAGEVRALFRHDSPPLREIASTLMKASQNQYAETLLRAVGRAEGVPGTAERGRDAVRLVLTEWGISPDTLVMIDGSGLSRYNYVTAGTLSAILDHMYRNPRHRQPWLDALAVAGVDGTLERRYKGTAGEGRVRAKTGSLSNVRALSGYVPSAGGETLSFVIVFNNVTAAHQSLDAVADAIVLRIARFAR